MILRPPRRASSVAARLQGSNITAAIRLIPLNALQYAPWRLTVRTYSGIGRANGDDHRFRRWWIYEVAIAQAMSEYI